MFNRKTSRYFSNYGWALPHLVNKPMPRDLVLDVGSYDLKDSIFLVKTFGCQVISFEADPSNLEKCYNAYLSAHDEIQERIYIDPRFLGSETNVIEFYKINIEVYGNDQASSKYKLDFSGRLENDPDYGRKEVQDLIQVPSVRYEHTDYQIPHSIFMDVQGSELDVLIGIGDKIGTVHNIVLETSFENSYLNSSSFPEIDQYLMAAGFNYIRSSIHGSKKPRQSLSSDPIDFDVIYSRVKT